MPDRPNPQKAWLPYAHGAVVGDLKTNGFSGGQWETFGNGIYGDISGGLAETTDGAVAQALAFCKGRHQNHDKDQFCQVVFQW